MAGNRDSCKQRASIHWFILPVHTQPSLGQAKAIPEDSPSFPCGWQGLAYQNHRLLSPRVGISRNQKPRRDSSPGILI